MSEQFQNSKELPATSDDVVSRARAALDERANPTNTGHGHVRPRLDGSRARCGGPRLCKVCQQEAARTPDPWDLVRDLLAKVERLRGIDVETARLHAFAAATPCSCSAQRSRADTAEAERDEARAAVDRVREALNGHPTCDVHPDDDPITCGWKRVVADVTRALDGEATS